MSIFKYGEKEIKYLKEQDEKLGKVIDRIGMIEREINPCGFSELVRCIISQQISDKASETVTNRFCELVDVISAENIGNVTAEEIQKCGMSNRKAGYIKGIAQSVLNGDINFSELDELNDREVIKKLVKLNGVGEWTAEMLLIFSYNRMNILSYKDLAIRRGIMNLYGHEELTKEMFDKYKERYAPYGSVASLYLWKIS